LTGKDNFEKAQKLYKKLGFLVEKGFKKNALKL